MEASTLSPPASETETVLGCKPAGGLRDLTLLPEKKKKTLRSRRTLQNDFDANVPGKKQYTSLLDLPQELLLDIIDAIFNIHQDSWMDAYMEPELTWNFPIYHQFDVWRDIAHLAATCKSLYARITPTLYREDVELNYASALLLSAKNGNVSAMTKSLDNGAEVDMEDWTELYIDYDELNLCYGTERTPVGIQMTALQWASFHHHVECVKLLLERGANVDIRGDIATNYPNTLFSCKALEQFLVHFEPFIYSDRDIANQAETVRCLPPWIRHFLGSQGANALYYAVMDEYKEDYHTFRDDFSKEKKDKRWNERIPMARLLLQAGVSLTTHTKTGLHALHQSCRNEDLELTNLFLEEGGADPNTRESLGNTPLHYLATTFSRDGERLRDIITLMIQYGADINAVNLAGLTPLQTCLQSPSCADVAMVFIEKGAEMPPSIVPTLHSIRQGLYDIEEQGEVDRVIYKAAEEGASVDGTADPTSARDLTHAKARAVFVALYSILKDRNPAGRFSQDGRKETMGWSIEDWKKHWGNRFPLEW